MGKSGFTEDELRLSEVAAVSSSTTLASNRTSANAGTDMTSGSIAFGGATDHTAVTMTAH